MFDDSPKCGENSTRQPKHIAIDNGIRSLRITAVCFESFLDELLGESRPKNPEGINPNENKSFGTVYGGLTENLNSIRENLEQSLALLKDLLL